MLQEIEFSGYSQTGPVREDNQDAIRLPGDHSSADWGRLCALADGMGGYAHGGIASTLALETLYEAFFWERAMPALKNLRRSVESANLKIMQTAQRLGAGHMGSTLTAAYVLGQRLYLAHVGDSRAYLVRDGRAACLTNDHTTVGELVRMKVLSPDKVRSHAQRSVLTKGLGLKLFANPDLNEHPLKNGDALILCSDGVWSVIEDQEFARLAQEPRGAEALVQDLLSLALERQTDDNISAIAVRFHRLASQPATVAEGHSRGRGLAALWPWNSNGR